MTNIKSIPKLTIVVLFLLTMISIPLLFAQELVLEGEGMTQDEVIFELLLDPDTYTNGGVITLSNFIYYPFGTMVDRGGFYKANLWFESSKTYAFKPTDTMYDYNFNFMFQPNTIEGKKLCMKLNGHHYTAPVEVSMTGVFYVHTLNTGLELPLFMVETLTINDIEYTGDLPTSIEK